MLKLAFIAVSEYALFMKKLSFFKDNKQICTAVNSNRE